MSERKSAYDAVHEPIHAACNHAAAVSSAVSLLKASSQTTDQQDQVLAMVVKASEDMLTTLRAIKETLKKVEVK